MLQLEIRNQLVFFIYSARIEHLFYKIVLWMMKNFLMNSCSQKIVIMTIYSFQWLSIVTPKIFHKEPIVYSYVKVRF